MAVVGVAVGVAVGDRVGEEVGDGVGVLVGIEVGAGVGDGVGEGEGMGESQVAKKPVSTLAALDVNRMNMLPDVAFAHSLPIPGYSKLAELVPQKVASSGAEALVPSYTLTASDAQPLAYSTANSVKVR